MFSVTPVAPGGYSLIIAAASGLVDAILYMVIHLCFFYEVVRYIAHALLCMRKVSMIPTNNFRKLEDCLNPSLSPNSPANLGCTR
jgi:hypothetical protein